MSRARRSGEGPVRAKGLFDPCLVRKRVLVEVIQRRVGSPENGWFQAHPVESADTYPLSSGGLEDNFRFVAFDLEADQFDGNIDIDFGGHAPFHKDNRE